LWKLRDHKTITFLTQILDEIIDYYGLMIGHSKKIDKLFFKLLEEITKEVNLQKQLLIVRGKLDSAINLMK